VNVGALLANAVRAHAPRTAVRYGEARLDYAELGRRTASFGTGLLALGLSPGDRVAVFAANSDAYVVALVGALRAGLAVVPVNARLHPRELAYVLEDARCGALVYGAERRGEVEAAIGGLDVPVLVRAGGAGPGRQLEAVLAAGDAAARDADVAPDDVAWLFYTSGTTGRPKGAMLTHRNLVAMTMSCLADVCSFQPEDVVLHAAPLSHGSGLYLLAALARGADNVILNEPRFEPDAVLSTVAREQVTVIAFVAPTMIVRLLDGDPAIDTSSLRCVVYGGAPIHAEHARAAVARFGRVLVQIYGQGESPMTITYLRAEDHDPDDPTGLVPAGIARTDVEVRVVDDADRELPAGAEGEVVVRGDVVMAGYWRNPEATERALRGGWLHTGDIGRFDEHGQLFLLDRKHDMIISGGSNIYPREVEEVLVLHPGVHEAVVFGVPDREWGESVAAAVVPVPGAELAPDRLIAFCREHLASFKKPRHVLLVDALPKNAYGKVLRRELRESFLAGRGS
jgi:long-chain acyl-CoA synthetase